jgi:hypothetical protein
VLCFKSHKFGHYLNECLTLKENANFAEEFNENEVMLTMADDQISINAKEKV